MNDRFNTAAGWVLFSGIIALGFYILSGMYFHADKPEHPEKPGYFVAAADAGGGADSGPSLAELLNTGDAEAGKAVFAKCMACHTIDAGGATGIGPNLNGILGTAVASHAPGFAYSGALKDHGGTWDYETMDAWLKSPAAFAAGTKMSFAGLSKAEDRANVILYMRENGGGPALPTFDPQAEAAAAEGDAAAEGEAAEGDEAAAAEGAEAEADAGAEPEAEAAPAE